jgi:hypothetical protein
MVTSLSGAIHDAVGNLVRACLDVVADDESSPLRGRSPDGVTSTKGGIYVVDAPSIGETYVDILARHGTTGDNRGPTFRAQAEGCVLQRHTTLSDEEPLKQLPIQVSAVDRPKAHRYRDVCRLPAPVM